MSASLVSSRLISLLSDWNARREAGLPCGPADVCPDDPRLQQQLAEHIAVIRKVEGQKQAFAVLDSADDTPHAAAEASTVATAGLPSPPGLQIQDELGRGGMGVVFRAVQGRLNRTVALKMILLDRRPDRAEVTRFVAEAEAMAAVRHPNVVQVFDCGEHDGRPYLAMELLTGGSLKERLPKTGMPASEAAGLVEKLARGVHAAHTAGIVHRDLKPGNVLFDADGTPKVTDFGLAKRGELDQTQTNAVVGTPAYMSPEQARGEGKFAGPPADVWSLGVILYECLTGRRPFTANAPLELMGRITTATPDRPGQFAAVPRDLERVCLKCLAKDPADRYRSAAALAEDLQAFREGRPVSARPIPTVLKMWKWTKRNPVPTGLVVAVLAALAATAGFFQQSAERATAETLKVSAEAERAKVETQKAEAERQAEAELRQKELLATAKLASQRGAGKEAVAAYAAAVAAGATLTDEQRIDRAGLLFDISASDRREYLLTIDPAALPQPLRGRWHLINGFDLIGRDEGQATAELTRAIALLPADSGDVSFARGLLEPDVEKSLKLLAEAIARSPTARDPRHVRLFILFMHGRFAEVIDQAREARLLAPDDPNVAVLAFLSHCALKQKAEAKEAAAVMRKQFPPDLVEVLELVAPLFLGASVYQPADLFSNREFVTFLVFGGLPKIQRAMAFLGGDDQSVEVVFRRSPRCLQSLTRLFGYMARNTVGTIDPKNLLGGVKTQANGGLLTDAQFEELKGYAATSPEGFVRFWYAGELLLRNKYANAGGLLATSRRLLAPEASAVAEQFEAGWRAKGALFDARAFCLQGAIMYHTVAALGLDWSGDYDPVPAKRAAALIRETLHDPKEKGGPLGYMGPAYYVQVALTAGDRGLALAVLERWQRDDPHHPRLCEGWAIFHSDQGNWQAAWLNAMMALENSPEHPVCLKIFRDSTDRLRQLGQAGY